MNVGRIFIKKLAGTLNNIVNNNFENFKDYSKSVCYMNRKQCQLLYNTLYDIISVERLRKIKSLDTYHRKLLKFIKSQNIQFYYEDMPKPMWGASIVKNIEGKKEKAIKINTRLKHSGNKRTFTIVHELAHTLLHNDIWRKTKPEKLLELEANAVCFIVCASIGVQKNLLANQTIIPYLYPRLIKKQERRIKRAARKILGAII